MEPQTNTGKKFCSFCGSLQVSMHVQQKDFIVYACKDCSIAFTYPPPSLPEYEAMDFHANHLQGNEILTIQSLPVDWQNLVFSQIKFIQQLAPQAAKIMEVGCGEGLLLSALKDIGYVTYGIEPSATAVARSKPRELNIDKGYFPAISPAEKQDVIIMSHVLEHIEEPSLFLKNITESLKPGGVLMLTQTNYRGLIPRLQKSKWYGWVPDQHFWHFTINGLDKYLSKFHFTPFQHKYVSLVHPHGIAYRLASLNKNFLDQYIVAYRLQS